MDASMPKCGEAPEPMVLFGRTQVAVYSAVLKHMR